MARPQTTGISYFSFDSDLPEKDFVFLIEERCGLAGFAIFVKILCKIYEEEGYYLPFCEKKRAIFSRKIGATTDQVNEVLAVCLEEGIFSKEIFDEFTVLTSRGIQKRYFEATRKRLKVEVKKELNLLKKEFPAEETPKKAEENPKNSPESTQSKVKESKVKETKKELSKDSSKKVETAKAVSHTPATKFEDLLEKHQKPLNEMLWVWSQERCVSVEKRNEVAQAFVEYWSAKGDNDRLEAWQKCKTFSITQRFSTWLRNEKNWNSRGSPAKNVCEGVGF